MTDHEPLSTGVPAARPSEPREKSPAPASNWFVEFFSQKRHLAAAARSGFESSDPGFREFELGLAALRDGDQMASSEGGRDPALLLLRSAIRLLVRATVLRRGHAGSDLQWVEIWSIATTLPVFAALSASLGPVAMTEVALAVKSDEPYLATLQLPARKTALTSMRAFAKILAAPLEHDATLVPRIQWKRRRRLGMVAFLLIASLAWSIFKLTKKENLALHHPVVLPDNDPSFKVDPKQVVDGDRLNIGFHTALHANTMVTIDLGAVKQLHRVEVYNRVDCCQERAVPLLLQVSTDGRSFREVTRTVRKFDVWKVPMPAGTSARFLRLLHEQPATYFHLSEIEVY